jgi:hypothetical protein
MALTLKTTISDPYANSYVVVDFADDYFENHYSPTVAAQWAALTDDQKTYLLIRACLVMETIRCTALVPIDTNYEMLYDRRSRTVLDLNVTQTPVKLYYYQALQFPRNLDRDPLTGVAVVPQAVQMAQCEQAIYLLNYDETNQANRIQGVQDETLRIGSIHTHRMYTSDGSAVAPMTVEFIRPYMMKSSTSLRRA